MREWTDQFNPFNSMKVLLWRKHLEHCAKDDYLPPVTVDTDPSNKCNYRCLWCNAYDMITTSQKNMSENHLLKLADFFRDWGALSSCVAGGGEPLMNPGTMAFLERMHINGLECGFITNGSLLTEEKIKILANTCRWVGFSMDAATSETYSKVKGFENTKESLFNKVLENIKQLTTLVNSLGVKNDIAWKFLLHPLNADEIFAAAYLAKSLGVKDFHLRPVGWENLTKFRNEKGFDYSRMLKSIDDQIEKALSLEDNNFRVYGVRHKFAPDFSKGRKNFRRCWAIPILPTFGADGNVHLCFDMRGNPKLIMCRHDPDPNEVLRYWNSKKHVELVKSVRVNECPRCTFSLYNEAVEKVIIEDKMCYKFP